MFSQSRLPLADFTVVQTSCRDEALSAAEAAYSPMSLNLNSASLPFNFHLCSADLGRLRLISMDQRIAGGASIIEESADDAFVLEIPVHGSTQVQGWQETVQLVPGRSAHISAPGRSQVWTDTGAQYRSMAVKFDRKLLNLRLNQLSGNDGPSGLTFDPRIDLQSPAGQGFALLIANAFQLLEMFGSIFCSKTTAALYEEMVIDALLTNFSHSGVSALEAPVYSSSYTAVRRVEDYVEANLENPITVAELADVAGVSVRSLQRTFQEARGITPMQHLNEMRLDQSRTRLLHAGNSTTVTRVAFSCGFGHLGAFGVNYRRRFGETPSQTLTSNTMGRPA